MSQIEVAALAGAAGIISMGSLLHLVGMVTPNWKDVGAGTIGLWEICFSGECETIEDKADWLIACDFLSVMGVLTSVAAIVLIAFIFFNALKGRPQHSKIHIFLIASTTIAATFIIICIIIFASKTAHTLKIRQSFYLSTAGGVLIKIGGIIGFIISRRLSCGPK
ncbi:uncharacterized protein LOC131944765 [Physella acuta]|uniref:uncharacterized protein LOC131944765 n=1 Tax=Physella acuta TaxID=109671 RepID=UPI0027DE8BDC|nr:uncharacterized protein LOC131944765 [Physella acuta]XP_059161561.1 uncharacterized protein LOC131944765 [Physella acuta]